MAQKIQLRRGISTTWTSDNPELAQGEIGFETDTGKFKIGNGTQLWNALSYATVTPADLATEIATAIAGAALGSTDDLSEGVQNLYFNTSRVAGALNSGSLQNISFTYHSGSDTIDVYVPTVQGATGTQGATGAQGPAGLQGLQGSSGPQGVQGTDGGGVTTQQLANAIAGAALGSTDDLPEGVVNKYFTTSRVAYVHTQGAASNTWNVTHNLGFYPNVTVQDSAGTIYEGEITYTNSVSLTVTFSSAFSGKAYLS